MPIFILGMPRSGTPLLEQMLSSHSKIHGLGEKGILQNIVEDINYPFDINNLNIESLTEIRNVYINRSKNLIPNDKTIITDKLPHNFLYIGLIKQLLPESQRLFIFKEIKWTIVFQYIQNFLLVKWIGILIGRVRLDIMNFMSI